MPPPSPKKGTSIKGEENKVICVLKKELQSELELGTEIMSVEMGDEEMEASGSSSADRKLQSGPIARRINAHPKLIPTQGATENIDLLGRTHPRGLSREKGASRMMLGTN